MISSRTQALIVQAHVLCVDVEPDAVQALLQGAHTGEASCQLAVTSSQQADEDVVLTLQSAQASEASSRLDSVVDVPISQRSEAHQALVAVSSARSALHDIYCFISCSDVFASVHMFMPAPQVPRPVQYGQCVVGCRMR